MAELSYLCLSLMVKHWCINQHQHKVPFQFNVIRYLSRINPPSKGFQTHRLLDQILIPKTNLLIRFVVVFGINNGRKVWFKYFVNFLGRKSFYKFRNSDQGLFSPRRIRAGIIKIRITLKFTWEVLSAFGYIWSCVGWACRSWVEVLRLRQMRLSVRSSSFSGTPLAPWKNMVYFWKYEL